MNTGGHHSGDMSDVGHQDSAHFFRNLPEACKINDSGVSTGAGHDDFRAMFFGDSLDLIKVNPLGITVDTIADDFEIESRKVQRMSVRKMPALGEFHSHESISRFHHRHVSGNVGLRP